MAISSTVLRQVGITDDPDVITETLTEALTTILGQQHRADPATALTAGEREA